MDSPTFKVPTSPGAPLFPISPERLNHQKIPASPSLPTDLTDLAKTSPRHHRNHSTASDVQSKVAVFNNLTRESNSHRMASDAALKRAVLGREEAESELQGARAQLSESRNRERRVGERLESLFEELATLKERQAHERSVFEKEVRRARKEAFRASSTVVKLQEELKTARDDNKSLKEQLRTEKTSRANAEQTNFEFEYRIAGMTEELELLREKTKMVDEPLPRIEEQEEPPKPTMTEEEMEAFWQQTPKPEGRKSSSRRNRFSRKASPREDPPPKNPNKWRFPGRKSFMPSFESDESGEDDDNIDTIKRELRNERRQRQTAEEMIHFLKMECQFQRCSCRIAEAQGTRYIHDHDFDRQLQKMEEEQRLRDQENNGAAISESENTETDPAAIETQSTSESPQQQPEAEPLITFSPATGTFRSLTPVQSISTAEGQILTQVPEEREDEVVQDDVSQDEQGTPVQMPNHPIDAEVESETPRSSPGLPALPDSSPEQPDNTVESEDIIQEYGDESGGETEQNQETQSPTTPTTSPPPIRVPTSFATPSAKMSRPMQSTPHRAPHTTIAPSRIVTTTVTTIIPLSSASTDIFSPAEGATPITRGQALEQIRARRARARSFVLNGAGVRRGLEAGTPGKEERRDISAPAKC